MKKNIAVLLAALLTTTSLVGCAQNPSLGFSTIKV